MDQNGRKTIYLPQMPNLTSDDLDLQDEIYAARSGLVRLLKEQDYFVEQTLGEDTYAKNFGMRTHKVDGVIFPPMSGLVDGPGATKIKAQRFFEAISVLTSVHVGDHRIFGNLGISKPCGFIDTDGGWQSAFDLLRDMYAKGAFSTKIEDIAFCVTPHSAEEPLTTTCSRAVEELGKRFVQNAGKARRAVPAVYPDDHIFTSFRKDFPRSDFGVIVFGSATMNNEVYIKEAHDFCRSLGRQGVRLITGAGKESLMGAFDRGFHEGAMEFNHLYPDALAKPAHIGISTNDVLRLEGPPDDLDQLIVLPTRNERLVAFINGSRKSNKEERCSRSAKVACIFPGGIGTLEEFATMMQLKLHGRMMEGIEIHLCNINGYYDKLIEICEKLGVRDLFRVFHDQKTMMEHVNTVHKNWLDEQPDRGLAYIRSLATNRGEDRFPSGI